MSRPTPKTDASIIERRHIHKSDGSVQLVELIDAAFARRLERERDEAREALQILADYTKNEIKRLRMICQHAHDRLLRGAPDNDLLLILEKSWKEKTK